MWGQWSKSEDVSNFLKEHGNEEKERRKSRRPAGGDSTEASQTQTEHKQTRKKNHPSRKCERRALKTGTENRKPKT